MKMEIKDIKGIGKISNLKEREYIMMKLGTNFMKENLKMMDGKERECIFLKTEINYLQEIGKIERRERNRIS